MTLLGYLTKASQSRIVEVANNAMALRVGDRIDVADLTPQVRDGVTERLDYAGVAWRQEGRFLVMGR